MNRLTQAVLMLLFGGAIIRATVTDMFLRYVKAGLRPYLLVAGVLLVATAIMTIWYEFRPAPPDNPDPDAADVAPAGLVTADADSARSVHAAADSTSLVHTGADSAGSVPAAPDPANLAPAEAEHGQHDDGHRHRHGHGQHDDGHGHGQHEPQVGWLLILPVLGLLLVAPPALGSFSANQAGTVLTAPAESDYPPLPPGDPASISLLDYASRALFDNGKSLTGRTVRLSGFITPGPGGQLMLARIVLTCCAADGRPIKIGLTGDTTLDAAPDTWVQIDGRYSPQIGKDPVNHADIAYLQVKTWQEISEPAQPYS